ncbi:MAG: hypothetical protein NC131_18475 [Roseburia sp.]|nr:hypothetical protein [Roseburia sp.]
MSKAVEELSKEICHGCKTRHSCDNNDGFCVMSDVVAEWLIEHGYGNLKKFAEKLKADYGWLIADTKLNRLADKIDNLIKANKEI